DHRFDGRRAQRQASGVVAEQWNAIAAARPRAGGALPPGGRVGLDDREEADARGGGVREGDGV
ncbi:MAG: hypothetical protein AVDCRST_MAG18-5053, partial [uncultured Thermomicrobiales bacterium]